MADDGAPFRQLTREEIEAEARKRGLSPAGAAGLADNVLRESGGKSAEVGDSGTSFGLFQHHAERGSALKAYASAESKDWRNPSVQFDFAFKEMREQYPKLLASLSEATDRGVAEESFKRVFERPKSIMWTPGAGGKYRFSDYALAQGSQGGRQPFLMSPEDYLALSPELEEEPFTSRSGKSLRRSFDLGDEIEELPSLDLRVSGPTGTVTAQDGRHRALLAQEQGLDTIPVAVKMLPRAAQPPSEVVGMQGKTLPAPSLWQKAGNLLLPRAEAAEALKDDWKPVRSFLENEAPKDDWQSVSSFLPLAAAPSPMRTTTVAPPVPTTPPTAPDDASTTLGDLAAAATRGIAPYAAGAGIGAALGGPPGAVVGAGLVAGSELLTGLASPFTEAAGLGPVAGPSEATNQLLNLTGLPRPTTPTERLIETTAAGFGQAASGAGMANALVPILRNPLSKAVATILGQRPKLQAVSGAVGGAGTQLAAEVGLGPLGQTTAGFASSLLPFGPHAARGLARIEPKQAAITAITHGYVLPPAEATEGSVGTRGVPSILAGAGGKSDVARQASVKNQPVTNRLAALDLGLPGDTPLSEPNLARVRAQGAVPYDELKNSSVMPVIQVTPQFIAGVDRLGTEARAAAVEFPGLVDVSKIEAMQNSLAPVLGPTQRSTSAIVETIKRLRHDATANFKAEADPDKLVLARTQREAAGLLEDLLEDNLTRLGRTDMLERLRAGRQLIAKSYDVDAATDKSTLDVDARKLGRLYNVGKPMTGYLKVIADTANHFPDAVRPPARTGGVEKFRTWDILIELGAAGAAGHGNLGYAAGLAVAPALRPAARGLLLSPGFQREMVGQGAPAQGIPLSALGTTAVPAIMQ